MPKIKWLTEFMTPIVATDPPTMAKISTDRSYQLIELLVYMILMGYISVRIYKTGENSRVDALPALKEYLYFCFSILSS